MTFGHDPELPGGFQDADGEKGDAVAVNRKDRVRKTYDLHGSVGNKWFSVTHRETGDQGILLCQSKHKWHFFWSSFEGSASGHSPETAVDGGLGDVIGTDGELRSYLKMVGNAPVIYLDECDGLYRNSTF